MSLRQRIRGAINGFKLLRQDREVFEAIVRPVDEHQRGRYKRHELASLMARDGHYVYVASRRNARAVASTPLRLYTRSRAAAKGHCAWDTKSAHRDAFGHCGLYARKAISIAEDVTEIVDPLHPALSLLESVSPWLNGFELMEQTQLYLGLVGNAYWAIVRENGIPSSIWPLQPQYVDVLPNRRKFIEGYTFGRGEENREEYDAEDIIHFKNPNPNDPYYGMGDLAACVDQADLFVYLNQAAMSMLKNGMQPSLVVTLENATETERQVVDKNLDAKHSGAHKWWKILTFSSRGKTTVTTVDIGEGSTKFLDIPASRVRETIANCFDIPTALLTLDSAALATAKASVPQWQTMAIMPRCRRIEDQMNAQLVPMFGDPNIFFAFDNAIADDVDAQATRLSTLVGSRPIMTQNEARGQLRLEPIEEGDELNPPEPVMGAPGEETDRDSSAKGFVKQNGHLPRRLTEWPVVRT